jgi:MFS family permease
MALILSTMVIFVLMILHTLTMIFTPEPEQSEVPAKNILLCVKDVFKNKEVMQVTLVFVLYNIAAYSSGPFYGTYLIGELALSLKVISILSIASSIVRIFVSRFWGRYADKTSFSNMIQKCFLILSVGYGCVALAVPQNGMLMFTLYYMCSGIAMGGINSALINMIYDYVSVEQRADSLAVCQASSGLIGFLATLASSVFVSYVQNSGNRLLGIEMYAQQVVSLISCVVILCACVYVRVVLGKNSKKKV